MEDNVADQPLLNQIQRLVAEEHRSYEQGMVADTDHGWLKNSNRTWISIGIFASASSDSRCGGIQ